MKNKTTSLFKNDQVKFVEDQTSSRMIKTSCLKTKISSIQVCSSTIKSSHLKNKNSRLFKTVKTDQNYSRLKKTKAAQKLIKSTLHQSTAQSTGVTVGAYILILNGPDLIDSLPN